MRSYLRASAFSVMTVWVLCALFILDRFGTGREVDAVVDYLRVRGVIE